MDFAGQPLGSEFLLLDSHGAAGMFQHRSVGGLILIQGMRKRHQDRRSSDGREFRDSGSAGAGDDKMRGRNSGGKIAKEWGHLGGHFGLRVDLPYTRNVFLAGLLHDVETPSQLHIELPDCHGYHVRHDTRPWLPPNTRS